VYKIERQASQSGGKEKGIDFPAPQQKKTEGFLWCSILNGVSYPLSFYSLDKGAA